MKHIPPDRAPPHLRTGTAAICIFLCVLAGCATQSHAPNIHAAAASGQLDQVKSQIAKGVDINLNEGNFGTPLHQAIMNGQQATAEWLLANGADVDARSKTGTTPLWEAAQRGNKAMVQLLLAHKANPNLASNDGLTPLYEALLSRRQMEPMVNLLLQAGADPNARTKNGWLPLHVAAEGGYVAPVQALLEHGAQLDAASDKGTTPLFQAAKFGRIEVVEFLLGRRAKLEKRDVDGRTALIVAAANGNDDVCSALLRAGARLDAADDNHVTALGAAIRTGNYGTAAVLIHAGAAMPLPSGQGPVQERFEFALYQKLLADEKQAGGQPLEAKTNYTAALQSLTALRQEFSKTASAEISKAKWQEFWAGMAAAAAGALSDVGASYSGYQNYRSTAQISALAGSHSQAEYFSKASQIPSFSQYQSQVPPSSTIAQPASAPAALTAPEASARGGTSDSGPRYIFRGNSYELAPSGSVQEPPRQHAALLLQRVTICDNFIKAINQQLDH